jgi:NADPH:quinone reductase-like Zn-dependent oxidoreductase
LLVKLPGILGNGVAGTVVEVGPGCKNLKLHDKVFGFCWRSPKEKCHQTYITTSENLLGLIPAGFSMQEAVTFPNSKSILSCIFSDEFPKYQS